MAGLTSVSTETDTEHRVRLRRVLPPDRQLDNTTGKRGKQTRAPFRRQQAAHIVPVHLAPTRIRQDASAGTVGDAPGNTLADPMIGFRETQLIKPRGPWHTIQEVDVTTAEYVD